MELRTVRLLYYASIATVSFAMLAGLPIFILRLLNPDWGPPLPIAAALLAVPLIAFALIMLGTYAHLKAKPFIRCPSCGHDTPRGSTYCEQCGKPLLLRQLVPQPHPPLANLEQEVERLKRTIPRFMAIALPVAAILFFILLNLRTSGYPSLARLILLVVDALFMGLVAASPLMARFHARTLLGFARTLKPRLVEAFSFGALGRLFLFDNGLIMEATPSLGRNDPTTQVIFWLFIGPEGRSLKPSALEAIRWALPTFVPFKGLHWGRLLAGHRASGDIEERMRLELRGAGFRIFTGRITMAAEEWRPPPRDKSLLGDPVVQVYARFRVWRWKRQVRALATHVDGISAVLQDLALLGSSSRPPHNEDGSASTPRRRPPR